MIQTRRLELYWN